MQSSSTQPHPMAVANLLALDAACIAVAWQALVVDSMGPPIGLPERMVLALSVWLTYVADRLLDVRTRAASTLLSARHRFAKRRRTLWMLWWGVSAQIWHWRPQPESHNQKAV